MKQVNSTISVSDRDAALLKLVVKRKLGIDISSYKDGFLKRRVYTRMLACRAKTIFEYIKILERSNEERKQLLDSLSINVSRFFRDPFLWKVIRMKVLESAVKEALNKSRRLHIWSAGCAHGQEPYTIAIILMEIARMTGELPPIKIYATDIDESALQTAKLATYTKSDIEDVPLDILREYFEFTESTYRVRMEVRRLVTFKKHDLTKEPPLNFINIIFCRNVLIYFDKTTQYNVIKSFYSSLISPAYLILGATETLSNEASNLFEVVDGYAKIYRKKSQTSFNIKVNRLREF